ncbi:MAG: L,D-transpeptidase family protein, partial [Patescibacteria group bacterium]
MGKKLIVLVVFCLGFFCVTGHEARAENFRQPEIKIYDAKKLTLEKTWLAFDAGFKGGASVAAGDVNGDGRDEIIVGAGPGGGPQVRIFKRDGSLLSQFFVYPENFRGGVRVASCDFDKDGKDEIVTGPGPGGGPQVRIMTSKGVAKITPGFFPFDPNYKGGINVACGDVDGDKKIEVVIGVGVAAEPHVRVFTPKGVAEGIEIYPYAKRDKGGVAVAVANVDGGPAAEIVTSIYRFGRSLVKTYRADAQRSIVAQFEGWPEQVQSGFQVAGGDVDGDSLDEILVSVAAGGGPHVRAFEAYGKPLPQNFFPYESNFTGGTLTAVGDVDGDKRQEIVTVPGRNTIQGRTDYYKYIEVRLDEQRLYAYENGMLVKTFLVSTGINKYPTPPGDYSVLAKIPRKDYEWSYGPNHPDNYDIKDVDFNLRFFNGYYLHYAYWHHNFGHKMSHGCVNIDRPNSEWVYNWAEVG